jgi:alpha-1,2-mannosyltransferase
VTQRYRLILLGVLVAVVGALLPLVASRHGFFDLKVYHGAVTYWLRDGGMLYDWLRPGTRYGFTYPPFAAIAMAPMAFLPFLLAAVLTSAATVLATVLVLRWLLTGVAERYGLPAWYPVALALTLVALLDPVRETFTFGQVNMLLLALVAADVLLLGGTRFAGVGIGLATAVKLTPGVFLLYLLVTRQWRAAAVATSTAAAVTIGAAALAPDVSREFWTAAIWNTDRVGDLGFVSNQSLQGLVARLDPQHPSRALWAVLVVLAVAVWAWRCRAAVAAGDRVAGLALTGVLGCLISPVTWVHHLVWLIPALVAVVRAGLDGRRWLLAGVAVAYLVLCSRLVWYFEDDVSGSVAVLALGSGYVWVALWLLFAVPVRVRDAESVTPVG